MCRRTATALGTYVRGLCLLDASHTHVRTGTHSIATTKNISITNALANRGRPSASRSDREGWGSGRLSPGEAARLAMPASHGARTSDLETSDGSFLQRRPGLNKETCRSHVSTSPCSGLATQTCPWSRCSGA